MIINKVKLDLVGIQCSRSTVVAENLGPSRLTFTSESPWLAHLWIPTAWIETQMECETFESFCRQHSSEDNERSIRPSLQEILDFERRQKELDR